jgi:hypothetical protein
MVIFRLKHAKRWRLYLIGSYYVFIWFKIIIFAVFFRDLSTKAVELIIRRFKNYKINIISSEYE